MSEEEMRLCLEEIAHTLLSDGLKPPWQGTLVELGLSLDEKLGGGELQESHSSPDLQKLVFDIFRTFKGVFDILQCIEWWF